MAGILESMSSMLTPEIVGKLGEGLGLDSSLVSEGLGVAGPLVTGSLAKQTATKQGASSFMDLLNNAEAAAGQAASQGMGDELAGMLGGTGLGDVMGMLAGAGGGDLSGMLNGLMGMTAAAGGTGADVMQGILGQGVNAIAPTLSNSLGFDVKPLLTMAVPMVLGLINKARKEGNLDANGIAGMLQAESKAYAADPANEKNLALINEALEAGDKAAALRGKYNDADWTKIRTAPIAAAYLVAQASPSRGAGAMKEAAAWSAAVDDMLKSASPTSLLTVAFGGGLTGDELDKMMGEAPSRERALKAISDAKAAVVAVSPMDAAAFSEMVAGVARRVAEAAKEGGFLGIGGKLVSDEEQAALDAIMKALA